MGGVLGTVMGGGQPQTNEEDEIDPQDIALVLNKVLQEQQELRGHAFTQAQKLQKVEQRAARLERALLKKIVEKRQAWEAFKWLKHSGASLSKDGVTVTATQEAGSFVTVLGALGWKEGVHSYRVKLNAGENVFVGAAAVDEGKMAVDEKQFVGETAGISLHTTVGHVFVDGREAVLGEFATCQAGDDVGFNLNLNDQTFVVFKNGAPLVHKPLPLPALKPGQVWVPAVTLCGKDDQVSLLFVHPEDEEPATPKPSGADSNKAERKQAV